MRRLPRIKTSIFRCNGYTRVNSIVAKYVIVHGFLEVTGSIRSDRLLVIGGIKAKEVLTDIAVLDISAPSTIIDLKTRVLRVHKKNNGRLYCSCITANNVYLTYTHVNVITAKIITLNDGCVIDKLTTNKNIIIRVNSPYCSFRTNPLKNNASRILVLFNYHNIYSQDPFSPKRSSP
ncbi:hypothetical protein J4526_05370 [Desulfurococcaceae archaeon MEX13E-LK6-19]|nr:hypothetical protein J4526_05370 [Desulfurococcaceae archaeon MEX13E-LK6-19]